MSKLLAQKAAQGLGLVLLVSLTVLTVLIAPAPSYAAPVAKKDMSIAEARQQTLGTVVTVEGAVTVPSGAFTSFSFDSGFAIQDKSGGIYVSMPTNLNLQPKQKVRVTGQLADSFGLLILIPPSPADVEVRPGQKKIKPEFVATGNVNESTEGRLVVLGGVITRPIGNDLPYGFRLFVDDGSGEVQVFVATTTGIDTSTLSPGQQVHVTGFSGQFDDHYEVNPRFPSDIELED